LDRLEEGDNHASDTNNTFHRTPGASREASGKKSGDKTRRETSGESGRATRTGAVQAVQAGLGGDRGTHTERAGHAICLPVLSEVAPCTWSGAWVQKDAACPVGPFAPRGGIRKRWHVQRKKGRLSMATCA